jgi:hypothetical protein
MGKRHFTGFSGRNREFLKIYINADDFEVILLAEKQAG